MSFLSLCHYIMKNGNIPTNYVNHREDLEYRLLDFLPSTYKYVTISSPEHEN